jgi:hypothetical protein
MSPAAMAKHMRRWADVGIDGALVTSTVEALGDDRRESASRAPKKEGKLARTVRVMRPTPARTKRTGKVRVSLAAGSRSGDRSKAVPYASVLQTGKVGFPGRSKTREHIIRARRGSYGSGVFRTTGVLAFAKGGTRVYARSVIHPGSKFRAIGYLKVDERRASARMKTAVAASFERESFDAVPAAGGETS